MKKQPKPTPTKEDSMPPTSLPERLARVLLEMKINQPELGKIIGLDKQNVNHLLHGRVKKLKLEYALKIAEQTKFNPYWLTDGIEPVYRAVSLTNSDIYKHKLVNNLLENAPNLRPFKDVPVVGTVQAGEGGILEELQYPVGFGEGCITYPKKDEKSYALRVRGDSMRPRIKSGEFIVVEPSTIAQPGDDVVVSLVNGQKMVKEMLYLRDGELSLRSINEDHGTLTFNVSEVDYVHYVAAIIPRGAFYKDLNQGA